MENLSKSEKNKILKEKAIIDAAEDLFLNKGINKVTMDEIARRANYTKRTIYKHFTSKEDLYFAVAFRAFKLLFKYLKNQVTLGRNGYEKVYYICTGYVTFCEENPEAFRLINYIGDIKTNREELPQYKQWKEFDNNTYARLTATIKNGQSDGSIRPDIDAFTSACAITFLVTGLLRQMASNGDTFTKHFKLNKNEFKEFSLNLILESLKNK